MSPLLIAPPVTYTYILLLHYHDFGALSYRLSRIIIPLTTRETQPLQNLCRERHSFAPSLPEWNMA